MQHADMQQADMQHCGQNGLVGPAAHPPRPPGTPDRHDGSIKSMKKMLLVLECFSPAERRLTPSEIARRAGLPRATAHRIIQTLRQIGFLDQDRERDEYRLGLKLFELGSIVVGQADLHRAAAAILASLARVTGEVVHLAVFDGLQAVIINRFLPDSLPPLRPDLSYHTLGDVAPAHASACGKAMLAFQPQAVFQRLATAGFAPLTQATQTDAAALWTELLAVREHEVAFDHGGCIEGLRCIGAPIRDATGHVFAALSLCAPQERLPDERMTALAALICDNARAISRALAGK